MTTAIVIVAGSVVAGVVLGVAIVYAALCFDDGKSMGYI